MSIIYSALKNFSHVGWPGLDTGFGIGGFQVVYSFRHKIGTRLVAKRQRKHVHMRNVLSPLYKVWGSPKWGKVLAHQNPRPEMPLCWLQLAAENAVILIACEF